MMALRAFEASARRLSFAEAGRECCLTPGAIGRQIRLLEADLGVVLFHRHAAGLTLTVAGEDLLHEVRSALDLVERAMGRVARRARGAKRLSIATLPAFGARWLMPQYPDFANSHPDITVTFFTRTEPVAFEGQHFDGAIHYGVAPPPGTRGDWIMDEQPTPVCAPSLRHPEGLDLTRALARYRLLQHVHRPAAWTDWLSRLSIRNVETDSGPAFEQLHLMLEAALSGLGLALLPRFMVQDELVSGRLIAPFAERVSSGWGYWFVYPGDRKLGDAANAFRDWLLCVARADYRQGYPRG